MDCIINRPLEVGEQWAGKYLLTGPPWAAPAWCQYSDTDWTPQTKRDNKMNIITFILIS